MGEVYKARDTRLDRTVAIFDLGFAVSPDAAHLAYVSAEIVAVLHRANAEDDSVCARADGGRLPRWPVRGFLPNCGPTAASR